MKNKKYLNYKVTKRLYWEINTNFYDSNTALYAIENENPIYESDSLLNYYGISETDDTKLIFEEAVKDFKMSDEDKPHLCKLLTDFSVTQFLTSEQDCDFLKFLYKYNFCIGIINDNKRIDLIKFCIKCD